MKRHNCESIRPLLFLMLEGQIERNERAYINAHLAVCEACRSFERSERALTDVLSGTQASSTMRSRAARWAVTFGIATAAALLIFMLPAAASHGSIVARHLSPSMQWEIDSETQVQDSNHFAVSRVGSVEIKLSQGVTLAAAGQARFELDFVGGKWKLVVLEGIVRVTAKQENSLVVAHRSGSAVLGVGSHVLTVDGVRWQGPDHADQGPVRPSRDVTSMVTEGLRQFSKAGEFLFSNKAKEQTHMAAAEKLFLRALEDARITSSQRNTALFYLGAAQSRQGRIENSLQTYQHWLELYPSDDTRAVVLFFQAGDHEKLGNLRKARSLREQVIAEYPDSSIAGHAKTYMDTVENRVGRDRKPKVEHSLWKMVLRTAESKPGPNQDPVRRRRDVASMVAEGLGMFSQAGEFLFSDKAKEQTSMAAAEKLLRRAVEDVRITSSQRNTALFYLGAAQSRLGRIEDSLQTYQRWLDLYPSDDTRAVVLFFQAGGHEKLGNLRKARSLREQVIAEYPDSSIAGHAKAYMDTVENRVGRDPKPKVKRSPKKTVLRATESKPGPYLVVSVDLAGSRAKEYVAAAKAAAKFHRAYTSSWDGRDMAQLKRILAEQQPRNVLFVLRPETLDVNLHRNILLRTMAIDDDIFVDCAFGYLTARTGAGALALWQRIELLHENGLTSRTWMQSSITSSPKSLEYGGSVPVTAKAAGFDGQHFYISIHDPDRMAFTARKFAELEEASVIQFTGNGDPQGIWVFDDHRNIDRSKHWNYTSEKVGYDPAGEMPRITAERFRALQLASPIVWSGTCHSAATCNVYVEGDIVSTFGRTDVATIHRLDPMKSLALALIDAGAAALLAPIASNHGMSVSMEADFALRHGASLGEIVKSTYDDVALAADGGLVLDFAQEGRRGTRSEYVMQGGGANRILIGDPALRPFKVTSNPQETVAVLARQDGLRVTVERADGFLPRAWDIYGKSRPNDWRIIARVDVTDLTSADHGDAFAIEANVVATDSAGEPFPYQMRRCSAETYHGRRYLHLQANANRKTVERKAVTAVFEVRVH